MKKIKYISISCALSLLVIGGIILSHINMIKKDFNESDYKHIKIKSNWDKIYCDSMDSSLVCITTKDGYMEIYDDKLDYVKKVKLPKFKNIRINDNEIVIVKPDGTVWYCNTEKGKEFKIIDYLSDVDDIYPSFIYWIYKDKKGDFYYIQNHTISDIGKMELPNNVMEYKTPKLIKNLKDAEILSFDTKLAYKKNGNTYVKFYYISKDKLVLFDEDNNVTFDKCFEGILYEYAFIKPKEIYLHDAKKRLTYACMDDTGKVKVAKACEINIKINKIAHPYNLPCPAQTYVLDKKGKIHGIDFDPSFSHDDENSKPTINYLYKYKKFKNIYGGCYLYATDDKYLYKLDKD